MDFRISGYQPKFENHMKKKMPNETDAGTYLRFVGGTVLNKYMARNFENMVMGMLVLSLTLLASQSLSALLTKCSR